MNSVKKNTFFLSVSALIAAAAGVIYSLNRWKNYSEVSHHYEDSLSYPLITGIFGASFVLFVIFAIISKNKGKQVSYFPLSKTSFFVSFITAGMFLVLFLYDLFSIRQTIALSISAFGKVCVIVTLPLEILTSAFFFMKTFENLSSKILLKLFSLSPVLWCCCEIFRCYFNLSDAPLNDPESAITIICLSGAVFFLLASSRVFFGIATNRIFVFSSCCIVSFTLSVSLGRVVLEIIDTLKKSDCFSSPTGIFTDAALALVSLLAALRYIDYLKAGKNTPDEIQNAIGE